MIDTYEMTIDEKRAYYRSLVYKSATQAHKDLRFNIVGDVDSAKMEHTLHNEATQEFLLYLQPVELDGYVMCPKCENCRSNCLNKSGRQKMYRGKVEESPISKARRLRSELFMYNRDFFMRWYCARLESSRKKAEKNGLAFIARLNGTSDLSPLAFRLNGRCIVEMYPDVQFVEYTKVFGYLKLMKRFKNLDYTFSYDGKNWKDCVEALKMGVRVAVVFNCSKDRLPKTFNGIRVVDGDLSDRRDKDPHYSIVGLHYKDTGDITQTDFVVQQDDARIAW